MKRTKNHKALPPFRDLPKTYEELCRLHMPRTIHDEVELEAITGIIDHMAGHKLNRDQSDYLSTLADLASAYEATHIPELPELAPHAFLTAHLENIGMSATKWGELIGIDRSTASRLLRGERKLNTEHIRKTAKVLHLPVDALLA